MLLNLERPGGLMEGGGEGKVLYPAEKSGRIKISVRSLKLKVQYTRTEP